MKETDPSIPQQQTGSETNTEASVEFDSEQEAKKFYQLVKQRLLSINCWHQIAGENAAHFALTDVHGNNITGEPKKGDHLKIDVPGPGSKSGEGYDWVQIESIIIETIENEESIALLVRPAPNPLNENKDVAHFLSKEATSSFIVNRKNNKITAGVYGRNEKQNFHAEKIIDKARNTALAIGGLLGFAKIQWKSLVNGLISTGQTSKN